MSHAVLLIAVGTPLDRCFSQSIPTATQQMQLSAFSTITPISTGLGQGKNLTITAGADIAFVGLRRIRSVVEIRGNYPIAAGNVDKQKSFVAGPVIEYTVGRFRPYADFLIGKGAPSLLSSTARENAPGAWSSAAFADASSYSERGSTERQWGKYRLPLMSCHE